MWQATDQYEIVDYLFDVLLAEYDTTEIVYCKL
jgi:hypothetical protein